MSSPSSVSSEHSTNQDNLHNHNAINPRCAIAFPPACLFPQPATPTALSTVTDSGQTQAPIQLRLLTLPTEIFLTILDGLTVTSRVNLALTCKEFARVLSQLPNILTFDLPVSRTSLELFLRDESFQSWSVDPANFYQYSLRPGLPVLQIYHPHSYTLICTHCRLHITSPEFGVLIGYPPETYNEDYKKDKHHYCARLLAHMREHIYHGGPGWVCTEEMFELIMDFKCKELLRQMSFKYTKAAVLDWAIAWNDRLG